MTSTADLVKYTNGDMKDDNEFVIKTTLQLGHGHFLFWAFPI